MGVLNINSNSFYSASRILDVDKALKLAAGMVSDGASILDVGAMSSRPGAEQITPEEEINRLQPILPELLRAMPDQIFSIDTIWSKVAQWALDQGVHIINDISAWSIDPGMLDLVTAENVPYVLMHMQGTPKNMQANPRYEDVVTEVLDFLIARLGVLVERGMHDVIVDPGFGFGKLVDHNFELMANLHVFQMLERPILVGISRKSMIQKTLGVNTDMALNGTTALHMIALEKGAQILRTHDVREASECIALWKALKPEKYSS